MCIFMGGTPLGAPILGWVAEQWGARWTLIGGGALTAVGTVLSTVLFAQSGQYSLRDELSAYRTSLVREPMTRGTR
jgi:MFS family permease